MYLQLDLRVYETTVFAYCSLVSHLSRPRRNEDLTSEDSPKAEDLRERSRRDGQASKNFADVLIPGPGRNGTFPGVADPSPKARGADHPFYCRSDSAPRCQVKPVQPQLPGGRLPRRHFQPYKP